MKLISPKFLNCASRHDKILDTLSFLHYWNSTLFEAIPENDIGAHGRSYLFITRRIFCMEPLSETLSEIMHNLRSIKFKDHISNLIFGCTEVSAFNMKMGLWNH